MKRESSRDSGKFFSLGMAACMALLVVGLSPLWVAPVGQTRAQVLEQRGQTPTPGAICFTEGAALSAVELEQITGVPQSTFLQAAAGTDGLSSAQARRLVQDHYGFVAQPEDGGKELFQRHCSGCHADAAALPDLGTEDIKALDRLRQARPAQAHQGLRTLEKTQLEQLLDYLRRARPDLGQ